MVESPSSDWSHHRRHTACWDVVLHRKTTNIVRNLRPLTISAVTRRNDVELVGDGREEARCQNDGRNRQISSAECCTGGGDAG